MSRRKLPRRFAASHSVVAAALAVLAAGGLIWAAAAPVAAARTQDESSQNRTVIGGGAAGRACVRAVMGGVSDEAALRACDRAIQTIANDGGGRMDRVALIINRGVVHMRRNDAERALADFDAALAIEPDHPEALLNKGAVLVQLHRPGPAVAALTAALSHGVSTPYKAYYNRGAAREELGDARGAYEDYSTALEINPNWAPAEAEIARFVRGRQARLAVVLGEEDPAQGRN